MPEPRRLLPGPIRRGATALLSGSSAPSNAPLRDCAIYAVGRIGDFIVMLSAIRLLVATHGASNCALVIAEPLRPIAEMEFPGVPLIEVPMEGSSLFREMLPAWRRHRRKFASHRYELVVCLTHQRTLYHEMTLSWLAGSRLVRLDRLSYPTRAMPEWSLDLTAHLQAVSEALGVPVDRHEIEPRFTRLPAANDGRLLIYPLSRDNQRTLDPGLLAAALALWRKRSSVPIVWGGNPDDAAKLGRYVSAAELAGVAGMTVETCHGIPALLGHLAKAGAVLTGETGPAHIATALDKPAVVLIGGGFHGLVYPWRRSDRQKVVEHRLDCFGCGWRCTQPEPYCLTRLSPSAAAEALASVL